ncbi:B12-binding domain-containing radical SAM protein, partial [Candidatus Poribacteria bacterium]
CTGRCIYCADPLAKGRVVRLRPPSSVADELERLIDMGIDHLHTCDSEFNIPYEHAVEVCRELERRGLGGRIRWYAYCSPRPFDRELARAMRRAGCVGINFGVDSGDEGMLKRLKRDFSPEDLIEVARICREERIAVMFDLLLGAPGETEGSVRRTVELMRKAEPDRVGVAVGVRIYPGTELAGMLGVEQEGDGPTFFLEPSIADRIFDLLDELIGGDERFFFFDPSRPDRNYNYNANELLAEAIRRGYRGAYWDILRRIASDPAFKRQVA